MRPLAAGLILTLAGCGIDDAPDPSPPPPTLDLAVGDVIPGDLLHMEVTGANPGETVWVIRGTQAGAGPCPPQLSFCVDVERPTSFWGATADATGLATWDLHLPASLPVGTTSTLQALTRLSAQVSQTVDAQVLPADVMPDFLLADVAAGSPRSGERVSPRDYLGQVSGWYFGHAS